MSLMVQVSELSFYTDEGRVILDDVRLRIERGEWLFIVGPPESGKTVFLKLLLGELRPRTGQILVNDRNVTRLSREKALALRRSLGVVPQPPVPLSWRTVKDHLLFKLRGLGLEPEEAERKARDALENLGLASLQDRPANQLVPVERALTQLALAVCNDPILLLADEPYAGLDEEGMLTVLRTLQRLHQRKRLTIIATAQERELAERFGTRVVLLEDGRFIALDESPRKTVKRQLEVPAPKKSSAQQQAKPNEGATQDDSQ